MSEQDVPGPRGASIVLDGAVAIVTGASTGIGRAVAHALHDRGARVVVSGRRAQLLDPVASELDGLAVACDVSDYAQVERLVARAVEWGGRLDPNRTVRIACLRTKHMILYRIADPGPGFSLEQLEHAAISNSDDEPYGHMRVREEKGLRPGGFGLLMTRTLVDELIWNEAHNEVVFVKYLDPHRGAVQGN